MSGLMPAYILRETYNDGKQLVGGKVYFYESLTNTPKTVYTDYTLSIPHTNPVILDAGAAADIWLGDGAYRIKITDANDVQIRPPIDGVIASGAGAIVPGSNAKLAIVKTYMDLRLLTSEPDVVYICGRLEEGDGGAGIFQYLPSSVDTDDDGITLNTYTGARVYQRVYDGVTYGSLSDQFTAFNAVTEASVRYNSEIKSKGIIRLNQNTTVPAGASLSCQLDAWLVSSSNVTVTFQTGSRFSGDGICFAAGVQPVFQAGVCDAIRLSWFGGDSDYVAWAKLDVASTAPYQVLVDRTTTLDASNLSIASNYSLKFVAGCTVNFTGSTACNVDIVLDHDAPTQIMSFATTACVGTINTHTTKCYMEWFGGSYVNTGTSNAIPFRACIKAKQLDLLPGNLNYTVTSTDPLSYSEFVTWNGNGSKLTLTQDITVLGLYTNDITIFGTGSITHSSCVATKTISIVPLLVGPTSATDSILFDVGWITKAQNSQLSSPGKIDGQISACSISSNASINVRGSLWADGCTIQSTSVAPVFVFADDVVESAFVGCIVEAASTFMYSANASLVVTIQGCQNPEWSNGQAIHNGIATVNVIASGVRGNSTATTVDGINGKLFHEVSDVANEDPGMDVSLSYRIYTDGADTARWHGVGSPSFSSNFLVIGNSVALDSAPWGLNTIRWASTKNDGSVMDTLIDKVWRCGGQILVEIEYPTASPPDPESRICVAMVCPKMGIYTNQDPLTDHHIFGETTAINLPIKNGAKAKNIACIWGGQVTLHVPDDTGYICNDEWGDVAGPIILGPNAIEGIPRIVIYDKGNKITPAGTKIKIILGAYMPTSDQYAKYWPDTPFEFVSGTASQSVRPEPTYIREESPFYIRAVGGVFKTPYSFRSGDANGVQIAKTRIDHKPSTGYPTPADLPVTVWANGTTLNGSYS